MGKMFDFSLIILIILGLLFTYIFFLYLLKEYRRAVIYYNDQTQKRNRYIITTKEDIKRKKIKNNITALFSSNLVNQQVGYATLQFLDENGKIQKSEKIYKNNFSIGREDSNDFVLQDSTISRKHCIIRCQNNKFFICNLSQTNLTRINGIPFNNTSELSYGDIVELGNVSFRFADIFTSNSSSPKTCNKFLSESI